MAVGQLRYSNGSASMECFFFVVNMRGSVHGLSGVITVIPPNDACCWCHRISAVLPHSTKSLGYFTPLVSKRPATLYLARPSSQSTKRGMRRFQERALAHGASPMSHLHAPLCHKLWACLSVARMSDEGVNRLMLSMPDLLCSFFNLPQSSLYHQLPYRLSTEQKDSEVAGGGIILVCIPGFGCISVS